MFRRLRERGPVLLVPLAWTFVTAAHVGAVRTRTLLIAHGVMVAILVAFVVASWRDMSRGVLRVWRAVMIAGVAITLAGLVGLVDDPGSPALQAVAVYGWMLLPAAGLAYTGLEVGEGGWAYTGGAAVSVLGAVLYAAAGLSGAPTLVAGLVLVGIGQTAGIVDTVFRF